MCKYCGKNCYRNCLKSKVEDNTRHRRYHQIAGFYIDGAKAAKELMKKMGYIQ